MRRQDNSSDGDIPVWQSQEVKIPAKENAKRAPAAWEIFLVGQERNDVI